MDMKTLRKLNEEVINATARFERASFAVTLAEASLVKARHELSEAMAEYKTVGDLRSLSAKEREMVQHGEYIQAIKSLRERSGGVLGLKDAKDIVDAYRAKILQGGVA